MLTRFPPRFEMAFCEARKDSDVKVG
jgi:hypothetical protein